MLMRSFYEALFDFRALFLQYLESFEFSMKYQIRSLLPQTPWIAKVKGKGLP